MVLYVASVKTSVMGLKSANQPYYFPLPLQALASASGERTRSLGRSVRFTRSDSEIVPSVRFQTVVRARVTVHVPSRNGPVRY